MSDQNERHGWLSRTIEWLGLTGMIVCFVALAMISYNAFTQGDAPSSGNAQAFAVAEQAPAYRHIPIEDVRVGQRLVGLNPQVSDDQRKAFVDPDPDTHRLISLRGADLHRDRGNGHRRGCQDPIRRTLPTTRTR